MNLDNLTKEQKAELRRQLEAEDKAERARVQQERENYKAIVDSWVEETMKKLQNVSSILMDTKSDIFSSSSTIIQMKNELFNVKSDRKSDTLSTSDGSKTIRIGNRINQTFIIQNILCIPLHRSSNNTVKSFQPICCLFFIVQAVRKP